MPTILTVEDDAPIRRGIADALRLAGHEVIEAADGEAGLRAGTRCEYDLLLLDLVLPVHSGLEILREIRSVRPTQPIIILTAKGDEADRVQGLQLGADDYVVKPFSVKELLARVDAVLRRTPQRPQDVTRIRFSGCEIDFSRREADFADGQISELSERELDVLRYLALHATRPISRDELLSHVWQIDARGSSTRTVDMLVARLREKLRDDPAEPKILITVRGKGYMLGRDMQTETRNER